MKAECKQIRDALIDQILGQLSEKRKQSIAEHAAGCPACGQFRDMLTDQDRILSEWGQIMQDQMTQKAQEAAAAFLAQEVEPQRGVRGYVYYAAAVVMIAALLGLLWLLQLRPDQPPQEFVRTGDMQRTDQEHPQAEKQRVASEKTVAEKELQLADLFFEKGNVTALAALYRSGRPETKQAVLNYLAQIGTEQSLRTMAELMEAEAPAADPNLASETIPASGQTAGLSAADAPAPATEEPQPQAGVQTKLKTPARRHPDWPALDEEVKNFHATTHRRYVNRESKTSQTWIRLPDKVRDEDTFDDTIIIDDGTQRLTLIRDTKEAILEDSWTAQDTPIWIYQQPLTDHPALEYGRMFRDPNFFIGDTVSILLEDQSTEELLVYDLRNPDMPRFEATAWVDTQTLLPEKIEVRNMGDPNSFSGLVASILTLDFSPIPDEVFSIRIPEGYGDPAMKERISFTGSVVDLIGQPVAGANVYLHNWALQPEETLQTTSGPDGRFEILLPPSSTGIHVPPITLYAMLPNQSDFIAWTLLRTEKDEREKELGGPIPGKPGTILIGEDYFCKEIENGYETRGTWCVGARDIVLVMEPAAKIYGTVTDVEGYPVAGAKVKAGFDLRDQLGNFEYSSFELWESQTVTDEQGRYELGFLPKLWNRSKYQVRADAEGFVYEEQSFQTDGPLDIRQMDLQMHFAGPTVKGILKDNYGTPLPQRYIFVMVGDKWYWNLRTETDDRGRFILENCPDDPALQIRALLSHNSMPPHEKEKYENYVYYPDVTMPIPYEPGRMEYEIEMTAVLPEIVIEVEVVDSAGNPIPDFPVEIRGKADSISSQWKSERRLQQRTDETGYVRFTNVPDIEGLHLVFWGGSDCWTDFRLSSEEKQRIEQVKEEYQKYDWLEIPVEVISGQTEYSVRAVVLTREEAKENGY